MCRRDSQDPLLTAFLRNYQLNLLAVPRTDAAVGDLYVEVAGRMVAPGRLSALLNPGFQLPEVVKAETMSDISGLISGEIELGAGLSLLDRFLTALSAGALAVQVSAAYRRSRAAWVRFRLREPERDSVDPIELGKALVGRVLDQRHPLVGPKARYFITTAVVRTRSLSLIAKAIWRKR